MLFTMCVEVRRILVNSSCPPIYSSRISLSVPRLTRCGASMLCSSIVATLDSSSTTGTNYIARSDCPSSSSSSSPMMISYSSGSETFSGASASYTDVSSSRRFIDSLRCSTSSNTGTLSSLLSFSLSCGATGCSELCFLGVMVCAAEPGPLVGLTSPFSACFRI